MSMIACSIIACSSYKEKKEKERKNHKAYVNYLISRNIDTIKANDLDYYDDFFEFKKQQKNHHNNCSSSFVIQFITPEPSSAKCSLFIKYADRCAKSPDFVPTVIILKEHQKNRNGIQQRVRSQETSHSNCEHFVEREINLMHYFEDDPRQANYDYNMIVASTKDALGLLWLTKLKIN